MRVSELCLGTMTFGEEFNWGASKEESRKVFDAFVEAGGNFLDTANYYTRGTSEKLLGEWIQSNRDYFVLATKYSLATDPDNPNAMGNHRKNMVQALEASLKRLKTDYVDLYWIHAWDFTTRIDDVMRALDDMVRAGKVLHIGISDTPAWIVARGNAIAELRGWSEFVGMQVEYSLAERTVEREYIPMAEAFDMAITAWSPLAMGLLTGKYTGKDVPKKSRFDINEGFGDNYLSEKNLEIAKTVDAVASDLNCTPAQVALRWMLQKHRHVFPIVGAKNQKQLEENLRSVEIELSDDQMKRLDKSSAIEPGFPHDFLQREGIRKALRPKSLLKL